ncbi:unnamed protein product [Oppiella nova]|uniref:C2H2-type domain-containing protein n=1 Tax=Oppiella nova TaxID=334625 RepID=A0A7R9LND6_9ACAR|nr:unnamed protein product [Oppiella nova]CAG2165371.1 unnamed protein product [Oppiella nova]
MSGGMSVSCEVSDAVVMSSAMDALRDENKRLKNFYFVIESLEMQYKTLLRQDMQFTYQLIQNHTKTLTPQPFATTSAAKDTKAMQLDDTSNEDTSDQTSDDEDIGCDKQNNTRNELNAKQTRHSANASVYQLKNGIKETDGSDKSGANRLKFMCSWIGCDLRFRDNYALKAHIRLRHTNERPFACTDCHKSFADKKHLKEHQKIHSTGGQMFRCEFTDCHYETRREANLKEHVLRHKNIRNYKCDESGCDKSFVTNYELKVHKSHVHSEDRPFTCDWPGCEATYKSKQRLDDHKLSHLGVRQFACDFHGCAKNFITKKKLTQHRNEHIKPYACSWPDVPSGHHYLSPISGELDGGYGSDTTAGTGDQHYFPIEIF